MLKKEKNSDELWNVVGGVSRSIREYRGGFPEFYFSSRLKITEPFFTRRPLIGVFYNCNVIDFVSTFCRTQKISDSDDECLRDSNISSSNPSFKLDKMAGEEET